MLTDTAVRNAKRRDRPYKLADSAGLHLYVSATGSRTWRWRYKIKSGQDTVEKLLTLGSYPDLSLADARKHRDAARAELRVGVDPAHAKQLRRLSGLAQRENTFEAIARLWHRKQEPTWVEHHAAEVIASLQPIFKELGCIPIREITPPMVLSVLQTIESRPAAETARRVRQRMSAVFVFAIASGKAEQDPAAVVKGALAPRTKQRQPALTDLGEARVMLAAAEAEPAHPVTRLALRFLALTAVRPGEVRGTRWVEFEGLDGPSPLWRIPPERMKMKVEHVVPLASEAVEVLGALRKLGIRGELAFPSVRNWRKPMSSNALGYLLHRAGYHGKHVPHGWRSTFSSVMNERYPGDRAVIDLMLAHVIRNTVEAAYNRATHLPRRRELARAWAGLLLREAPVALDLLDGARSSRSSAAA